jgi:hypothetical protein
MAADGFVERLEIFANGKQDVDAVLKVRIHLSQNPSASLAGTSARPARMLDGLRKAGWQG